MHFYKFIIVGVSTLQTDQSQQGMLWADKKTFSSLKYIHA